MKKIKLNYKKKETPKPKVLEYSNKVENSFLWCLEDLPCSGIEKGDSFEEIVIKLNNKYCDV